MRTRTDELSNFLKGKFPDNYITGDDRCSLLVWGVPSEGSISPKLCTLTVGLDYEDNNPTKEVIRDSARRLWKDVTSPFKNLHKYGKLISQYSNIEFGIICFSAKDDIRKKNSEISFLTVFSSDSKKLDFSTVLNGDELRYKLLNVLNLTTTQAGTSKGKNKTTADFFHDWSRREMPSSIIKLDIDGLLINYDETSEKILVEIKRSNTPPIPRWTPYLNDLPDFYLLLRLSIETSSEMWILHHDGLARCTDATIVSLFVVNGINDNDLLYSNVYKEIKLGGRGQTVESIIKKSLHIL